MIQPSDPREAISTPRFRFLKVLLWGISILAFLIVVIAAVAPPLLSTSSGNAWAVKQINKHVNGTLFIDHFELSWTKGFEVVNLELLDKKGTRLFHVDRIQGSMNLISLLSGSRDYGKIAIQAPQVFVRSDETGSTGWEHLMGAPAPSNSSEESSLSGFLVNSEILLSIEHGQVTMHYPNLPEVQFNEIDVSLQLGQPHGPIALSMNSNIIMDSSVQPGSIHVEATVANVNNIDLPHLFADINNLRHVQDNSSIQFKAEGFDLPNRSIEKLLTLASPEFPPLLSELLGETTHLSLEGNASPHITSLNALVEGEHLKIAASGITSEGVFSLSQPASVDCTLTPALFQTLSERYFPEEHLVFSQASHLSLQLNTLTVPVSFIAPNFAQLQTDLLVTFSPIDIAFPKQKESCRVASLSLSARNVPNTFSYSTEMDASVLFHGKTIPFNSKFVLQNLFSGQIDVEGVTKTDNLPLALFDPFLPQDLPLTLLLGPQLSLTLGAQCKEGRWSGDLNLQTERLHLKNLNFTFNDAITLSEGTSVTYSPPSTLIKQLSQLEIATPPTLTLDIHSLYLPLDKNTWDKSAVITADLKSSNFTLATPFWPLEPNAELALNDFNIAINGKHVGTPSCKGHFSVHAQASPNFVTLVGSDTVTVDFDLALEQKKLTTFSLPRFTINLESPQLHIPLSGSFVGFEEVSLDSSCKLQYVLSPEAITLLAPSEINLVAPTPLTLLLDNFKFSVDGRFMEKLHAKGTLYVPHVRLKKGANVVPGELSETALNWKYSAEDAFFRSSLESHFIAEEQSKASHIYAQCEASHFLGDDSFNLTSADLKGSVYIEALQTAFIDNILDLKGLLPPLVGQELVFKTDFKLPHDKPVNVEMSLASEGVNASVALSLDDTITLESPKTPATVKVKLTPKGYQAINEFLKVNAEKTNAIQLTEPLVLSFSIDTLNILLSKNIRQLAGADLLKDIQPLTSTIHTKMSFPLLSLFNTKDKQRVIIQNFDADINAAPLKDLLTFDIHAEVDRNAREEKDNYLSLTGKMTQLFDAHNKLNLSNASIDLNTSLDRFPFETLTTFLPIDSDTKNQLTALIGHNLNAHGTASLKELSGPLSFDYKGGESQGNIKGSFSKGILTLSDPFSLSLNLNKRLLDAFFAKVNPTFSDILYAPSEINMKVEPAGVNVPLIPYKPNTLAVPSTLVNLNKIPLANKGPILSIMRLFPNSPQAPGERVIAWFTPIKISVIKGQVQIFRFDVLLADSKHFAMWGEINLVDETLDMMIGIPGTTIEQAYNVAIPSDDYMLQIPVKGSFGNIKVDWARASTQIASLVARNTSSPQGAIIGGILGLIGGSNRPYPPPTFPIPWEKSKPPSRKPAERQNNEENPAKIIKGLFGL